MFFGVFFIGATSHPFQACSAILPPANGAVNCQKTNNVL